MFQDWFPLIMVFMYFVVLLIHEYGHACAGRIVGADMVGIYIGAGKPVISIGHVHWSPRKFWLGRYAYENDQLTWGQRFLVSAGGILANLATGLIIWALAFIYPAWFSGIFASAFVKMSMIFVISNLIPRTWGHGVKSDGWRLRELWLSRADYK
ncbi:MAG: site-2 protease family protein [Exiguobacterium mexicanum]